MTPVAFRRNSHRLRQLRACALRDDTGCNEMPQNLESAISHEEADINNAVRLRSIAEIERGNSNDVFFGRPSYGFGHITAPPAKDDVGPDERPLGLRATMKKSEPRPARIPMMVKPRR